MTRTGEIARVISVQNEMLIAMEFIQRGLGDQKELDYTLVQKFFVMYNLSQGLERYLKLATGFIHLGQHGVFPTIQEFKEFGHGIEKLLDHLIAFGYSQKLLATADGRWGKAYLSTDPIFRKTIKILTNFGKSDRYYDMDIIGGMSRRNDSPEDIWEELESEVSRVIFPDSKVRMAAILSAPGVYEKPVYDLLTQRFEWGLYAVSRAIIIGDPTIGWPQHFLDYILKFGPPPSVYKQYL